MSILLTGGAGYIGSHTLLELLRSDEEVVVADNFVNSSKESIKRIEELTGKRVALYEIDLCSETDTFKLFEENPDLTSVVHFAGFKAVGDNLYKVINASGQPIVGRSGYEGMGVTKHKFVEMFNVFVVNEMVQMIVVQRVYEFNSKAIQTSDSMLSTAVNLKR